MRPKHVDLIVHEDTENICRALVSSFYHRGPGSCWEVLFS